MLNRWEGIGNLGKDPETRYSTGQNQTAICRFTVAVQKGYGDNKKTVWVNIVTFGKLAENCQKFLAKGRKVYVAGELDIREYEKQDGTKGYITEVAARDVEFLSGNENTAPAQQTQPAWNNPQWSQPQQSQPQQNQEMTYQQYQEQKKYENAMGTQMGFQALRDDDVPF